MFLLGPEIEKEGVEEEDAVTAEDSWEPDQRRYSVWTF